MSFAKKIIFFQKSEKVISYLYLLFFEQTLNQQNWIKIALCKKTSLLLKFE